MLKLPESLIDESLETFTEELQREKIKKVVEKELRLNRNKSSLMIKNKILKSLIDKGFYKEDIVYCLENYDIDESDAYNAEYEKIKKKLSSKYSGKELEYKIKEKLYQKGFRN